MIPKIIEDAAGPVLTLETLRKQCEIVAIDIDSDGNETHPDDDLLLNYLAAAVDMAEDFMGRAVALRTYEVAFSEFPRTSNTWPRRSLPVQIPLPPLVEIINFQDGEDSDGPVDPDTYTVDDYAQPALLVPVGSWPSGPFATNAIRIRYRAGYSSTDSDANPMPNAIKQALLLTVAHWYANRESVNVGNIASELPFGPNTLLRPLRVRLGMA